MTDSRGFSRNEAILLDKPAVAPIVESVTTYFREALQFRELLCMRCQCFVQFQVTCTVIPAAARIEFFPSAIRRTGPRLSRGIGLEQFVTLGNHYSLRQRA